MLVLALDAGSPLAAAALADGALLRAERRAPRAGEEGDLLALVAAALEEAGVAPRDLDGIVALSGPGSFTGTRVACATALGLAAATGARATGAPTLEALALAAPADRRRLAVVDALRGEWSAQRFAPGAPLAAESAAAIARPEAIDLDGVETIVGFDAARFAAAAGARAELVERPAACAAAALAAAAGRWAWDPSRLAHPLYLRAPATTRPR